MLGIPNLLGVLNILTYLVDVRQPLQHGVGYPQADRFVSRPPVHLFANRTPVRATNIRSARPVLCREDWPWGYLLLCVLMCGFVGWRGWRVFLHGGVYVPHQGAAVPDSRSLSWSFTFSKFLSPLRVRASLVFLP